jgi:hypothetical protein
LKMETMFMGLECCGIHFIGMIQMLRKTTGLSWF